jgi:pimeloyl-ACP methyl ester carboxylesterase
MKNILPLIFAILLFNATNTHAQTTTADTLVLTDITWGNDAHAGQSELNIPSSGSLLQGFIYKANGSGKHPTLLLLHGYPGNERNLDLAQVVRARGWNVIYFDYRGSWASQGVFSFKHCVEDVVSTVAWCKKYSDSLGIDTNNIALFGHSMGGWVCLKALAQLPGVKKGFALSTWDIGGDVAAAKGDIKTIEKEASSYFVLNASVAEQFTPVIKQPTYYELRNDAKALAQKQIIMLDEHNGNKALADAIRANNNAYFDYEVWPTDHPFTNKRVALIKRVLAFLNK